MRICPARGAMPDADLAGPKISFSPPMPDKRSAYALCAYGYADAARLSGRWPEPGARRDRKPREHAVLYTTVRG